MVVARTLLVLAALALAAACGAAPARAVPADPDARFELRQPDGTAVTVRPWGDEFVNGVETLDGYTLLRDGDWWEYARATPGDGLEPSGLRAGVDDAGGLAPHLRGTS